jgi:hypothetical protein
MCCRAHDGAREDRRPLPRALYDKMLAAKNFQSGMQTLRQVEFSLIDMHLHYDYDPNSQKTVQALIDDVRSKFSVMIPPSFNRFQHSFGHIFAGGYAAGYYSYKWAEVLSADAYAAFEEASKPAAARCRRKPASASCARSCRWAVRVRRSNRSRPSAAANRRSTRCCAIAAWRPEAAGPPVDRTAGLAVPGHGQRAGVQVEGRQGRDALQRSAATAVDAGQGQGGSQILQCRRRD